MGKIRSFIQWFVTITTGTLAMCALSTFLSGTETVPASMLWQAMLAGALCALATVLFFPAENHSKCRAVIGICLHFVSLCAIMVYCGIRFGWIQWALADVAFMTGCVILVYAFTVGVTCLIEYRQVKELNRMLKAKYASDDAEK